MEIDFDPAGGEQPSTVIVARRTRAERKQELHDLLRVEHGLDLLTAIYRFDFPAAEGRPAPTAPVMVARILSKEYPDG